MKNGTVLFVGLTESPVLRGLEQGGAPNIASEEAIKDLKAAADVSDGTIFNTVNPYVQEQGRKVPKL